MGLAGRVSVAATLVVGLVFGVVGTPRASAQDSAKVKQLYEEVKKALDKRDWDGALANLKALFQEDPTQAQVLDLIKSTETNQFLEMLTKGGEYELAAKRLLDLGHAALKERSRDEEKIRALVGTAIKNGNLDERRAASRTLMAEHGAYAVPFLVRYLGSNDTDERVRAIFVLEDIGVDAVLPLLEVVMNSPDAQVKQNGIVALRNLKDPRAWPVLKWLATSGREPESVRHAAENALKAYGGKDATALHAFLHMARGLYLRTPDLLRDIGTTYTLWRWEEGQLKYQDVPKFLYHLRLAEKAADMALRVDASSKPARAVLSLVYAAQKVAFDASPEEFKGSEAGQAEASRLAMADAAIRSSGAGVLMAALGLALEWNDAPVANAILSALPEFGAAVPLGPDSSLVQALAAPDGTVQKNAAVACAALAPKASFPRCELVVPLLADAVALDSIRQVLVIHPDTKTAVQLQTEINGTPGMHAVVARNGAQGLLRTKQVPLDAVLVAAGLTDIMTQQVVNEIRRDARTKGVPVLVVASEAEKEAQASLYGDDISGVVSTPLSRDVYIPQVRDAAATSPLDDRARALAMSERACGAIAEAAPSPCFDYSKAEGALAGTLGSAKPDSIKLKALAALARWGTPASLSAILDALKDSGASAEVRAAAARTAGAILNGKAPTAAGFDILVQGLSDESIAVRTACAGALGAARLTPDQRNVVLEKAKL